MSAVLFGIAVLVLFASIPLAIYHFLIFPNIDGVAQDISFYNYDKDSQHYLYWFFFWSTGIFGSLIGFKMSKAITISEKKEKRHTTWKEDEWNE